MATSVPLPELGESVTEGTVTRWLKQVGDEVAVDEPIVEISTDKVDTEIPSPVAGTLLEQKVAEDETIDVGAELAVIGEAGESSGGDDDGSAEESSSQEEESEPEPEAEAEEKSEPEPDPEPEQSESESSSDPEKQEPHLETKKTSEGTAVTLPELGESVTEGTVTRWLKAVGDEVAVDEPLLEISTDKVDTEIPSPAAGVLTRIVVAEDEEVEIGAELAVISGEGEDAGSSEPAPAAAQPAAE